ncbi:hypothetical protein ACFVZZ_38650 [Streptomyces chartreusis]|uniref:hypothetical protein n=1 Tax=Streptomyces chartreusis TaxID=1969 RepID=UPI0036DA6BDE
MDFNRRTAMAAGLGAAAATATVAVAVAVAVAVGAGSASVRAAGPATITIPGESPRSTNIPVAGDRRASGGRYLALLTAERPPGTPDSSGSPLPRCTTTASGSACSTVTSAPCPRTAPPPR